MTFLNKPVSELSLAELQRLIASEVSRQVPAIPAGVLALADDDQPLVPPDAVSDGQTLVYSGSVGQFGASKITANSIQVSQLSAITANMGSITSGTITGGTIQTAATDPRVWLDSTGFNATDASGNPTVTIAAADGSAAFAGQVQASNLSMAGSSHQLQTGSGLQIAGGVAQPLTLPALSLSASAGSLSSGTRYYVAYSWANEDTTQTVTVTLASPGVFTTPAVHNYAVGDPVYLTSTGSLPTGLISGKTYFVQSTPSTTTFTLAATRGGAAIATSGSQSGTHTTHHFQETQPSPVSSIVTPSFGFSGTIGITVPAPPAGVSSCFIYMDTASFGAGGGHWQNRFLISGKVTSPQGTFTPGGSVSATSNTFQSTATTGGAKAGAYVYPGYPTDTAGNDYSWRIEGNGRIRILGPTINCQYWWYSDFLNGGNLPGDVSTAVASGGSVGTGISTNVNPGVVEMATGTTSVGGRACVNVGGASTAAPIVPGVARVRFSAYFCIKGGIPNGTTNYAISVGLVSNNDDSTCGTAGNPCVAFTFNGTTNPTDSKFGLRCTDGVGTTFVQAVDAAGNGVTLQTGVYHLVDYEINPAGTQVKWWVDGVPQTTITTNVPQTGMWLHAGVTKTATAANNRWLDLDTMAIFGDFVS